MLDSPSASAPLFSLGEDQIAVRDMARVFAAKVFAPTRSPGTKPYISRLPKCAKPPNWAWAASSTAADVGGSALSRLDETLIFEALA